MLTDNSVIVIANPRRGGRNSTSLERAWKFVNEGRAIWLKDGRLFFLRNRKFIAEISENLKKTAENARKNGVATDEVNFKKLLHDVATHGGKNVPIIVRHNRTKFSKLLIYGTNITVEEYEEAVKKANGGMPEL